MTTVTATKPPIADHPDWPKFRSLIELQLGSQNASRFPVKSGQPDKFYAYLRTIMVPCAGCGQNMFPFRQGDDDSRVTMYVTGFEHKRCRGKVAQEYVTWLQIDLGKIEPGKDYDAVQRSFFDELPEEPDAPPSLIPEEPEVVDVSVLDAAIAERGTDRLALTFDAMAEPTEDVVRRAVGDLLFALNQDVTREGLQDTPRRVAAFLTAHFNPEPVKLTTFKNEGMDELIVQVGIPFYSLCEHHMVPFFGMATVGYVPDQNIVGLSKLTRLVHYHSAGLQNQERITSNIADALEALEPKAIGVLIRARHLCMEMRGVKSIGAMTVTSDLRGALRSDARARAEFLTLAREA